MGVNIHKEHKILQKSQNLMLLIIPNVCNRNLHSDLYAWPILLVPGILRLRRVASATLYLTAAVRSHSQQSWHGRAFLYHRGTFLWYKKRAGGHAVSHNPPHSSFSQTLFCFYATISGIVCQVLFRIKIAGYFIQIFLFFSHIPDQLQQRIAVAHIFCI